MGKIKRLRNKFHLSANSETPRSSLNATSDWNPSVQHGLNFMIQASDNIFAGIDIPVQNGSVRDDDTRTVVSTCKSVFKDSCRNKKERRQLRHQTFIEKINAIQALRKKVQKNKKNHQIEKGINEIPSTSDICATSPEKCDKEKHMKIRGTLNSERRHIRMLRDAVALQRMWENPNFKANPTGLISELVQERITKELK